MRQDVEYYRDLWFQKSGLKPYRGGGNSLPRAIVDRLLNPAKHDRALVAGELIADATGRLLDIGCWGGESLSKMGVLNQFQEVYGVDLIEESLDRARTLGIKAVRCNLNEESLPFSDNFFDVVTCLAVIGQIFDPFHLLAEMYRVLNRGGLLILHVPNVASFSNRVRLLFGKIPVTSRDPGWDGMQLHYFTLYDTKRALESQGFKVQRVRASGGFRAVRQLWPSLLSGTLTFKAVKR